MKKLLLLGGSAQQVVAIETAKRLGYATVLCDYLPDNPGQYAADTFYQVSTTDKQAVLSIAKAEKVDGVLAYASDPAAPTAAFVAEALGLPTNPYASAEILCNKDQFRSFLKGHGFCTPDSIGCETPEAALAAVQSIPLPVIIKPVDSSGSKGVTVLRDLTNAQAAVDLAFSFTRCHRVIVEKFLEKKHPYLIGGDIFVYEGNVVQWGLMNCHRDTAVNSLVPVGKSYPCELDPLDLQHVKDTLQALVTALQIQAGPMNVELIVDTQGAVWPIDVGPRSGGNMIPDLLGYIFGTDVVERCVKVAMGEPIALNALPETPYYATHNLHSNRAGHFAGVEISEALRPYVVRECVYKQPGDEVEFFDNAAKALGIVFFKFDTRETMMHFLGTINQHIHIHLEES